MACPAPDRAASIGAEGLETAATLQTGERWRLGILQASAYMRITLVPLDQRQ